ncbi:MAG TPA: hypothetical protein VHJ34_13050 [Actinomycetota bacterium]|nr:hypothetical protein [Actinomycetota bacterium]
MHEDTLAGRARTEPRDARPEQPGARTRVDRALGHPVAFAATAAILLALFSWTFVTDADRAAPTKDPAYYTWHTEVLISEAPEDLLNIEGAFEMFAGGYRVTAPVLTGYMRDIADVGSLTTTVVMTVAMPVLIALLLAGFAYRNRPDPLVFHAVAFGSAGLLLTDPFVGYLDNVLCLFFLAAALPFLAPARTSWPARVALAAFLLCAGLTHPTTLAIFCMTLGLAAVVRLVFRRFDLRAVVRDDGPMLLTAFAAALLTLAIWTIGPWGKPASLTEAALPPPYDSDFFLERLLGWIGEMRPVLNAPLFVLGAVGLLWAGKRAVEDEFSRLTLVWLAPLAGIFGFLAGLAYPYYRFLNTTLAWLLLVGLGAYFALRFFVDVSRRGGVYKLALLGVVAIAVVLGTNFTTGYDNVGWTTSEWISGSQRRDLDALRAALTGTDEERPVVFAIDDEPPVPFQIWGFTKLSGNTSRYGLPPGQIDQAYLYLGDVANLLRGEPTTRGDETYDMLSPALLSEAEEAIERSGRPPIVVVASQFNPKGANVELARGEEPPPDGGSGAFEGADVWTLHDGAVQGAGGDASVSNLRLENPGAGHLLWVLVAFLLLLLPGLVALRFFLPGAGTSDALGLAPAFAAAGLALVGFVVLAVARSPFDDALAWISYALTLLLAAALAVRGARTARTRAATDPRP